MTDITLANFKQDLIEASLAQPILLHVWSPRSEQCAALQAVLDKAAQQYGGAFSLAKLNADEVPEITGQLLQMFGVQSIPLCVLFTQGQPVDGFIGLLPENELMTFFSKHQIEPLATSAVEDDAEPEAPLTTEERLAMLQANVSSNPKNDEMRFDYIQLLLTEGQLEAARASYNEVALQTEQPGGNARLAALGQCITACERSLTARDVTTLQDVITAAPRDLDARFELAQQFFAEGDFTAALDALLEIIMRNKTWNEDAARKTFVAILELMTPPKGKASAEAAPAAGVIELKPGVQATDPRATLIQNYRRQLSMMLN